MTTRPPNYRYWSLRELWEVEEGAWLLLGIEPGGIMPGEMFLTKLPTIMRMIRDAMDAGTLKPFSDVENSKPLEDRRVRPTEFLRWWQSKGFKIPTELAQLLGTPEMERSNSNAPPSQEYPETKAHKATGGTRVDNLTVAIRRALDRLGWDGVSNDEIWNYLADGNERDIVVDFDFNGDKLVWMDTAGKFHNIKKKSVNNRLGRLRSSRNTPG